MKIKFSQKMDTEFLSIEAIKDSIELRLDPFMIPEDFDENLLKFSWILTSYTEDEMMIKINFDHPVQISPNLIQDMMLVKFNNFTSFKSLEGNYFKQTVTVLMKEVPKQMIDNETTKNLISASENFDLALNIVFWILLVFNLIFGGTVSMEHFVLMINSLQIAMHVPLFSTALPGNVIMFLEKVIPIVMFDIIKEEWKINPTNMMEFDDEGNSFTKEE